jgi:hypothetical protein
MSILKIFNNAVKSTSAAIDDVSKELTKFDKKHKISNRVKSSTKKGLKQLKQKVENPEDITKLIEKAYGHGRGLIKSKPDSITPTELLKQTRKEMLNISSCILQINASENEIIASEFGNAVLSKIAGIATTGSLLGLVSTFGTAGTGAAISGLSGAAATSATLAWVGGLLGGGMAAGALMTGGVGIVAGLAAHKALKSTPRSFESLSQAEQHIVQTCWMLVAIIDDELSKKTVRFNSVGAEALLKNTLAPLKSRLARGSADIENNLDKKYSFIFRNHVLKDYDYYVISEFKRYAKGHLAKHNKNTDEIISKVIYNLLTESKVDKSIASNRVILALKLSDSSLRNSDVIGLSKHIQECSPDELKHIASKVKAVYAELLWVEEFNTSHDDSYAEVSIKTKASEPVVLIKDSSSRRIRDRWTIINNDFNKKLTKPSRKAPANSENLLADWNNADSPKSAVELLARRAGISVAASALTSLLFS